MFCIKCGNKLPENAGFCHKCGAKSQADVIATEQDAKQNVPSHGDEAPAPNLYHWVLRLPWPLNYVGELLLTAWGCFSYLLALGIIIAAIAFLVSTFGGS